MEKNVARHIELNGGLHCRVYVIWRIRQTPNRRTAKRGKLADLIRGRTSTSRGTFTVSTRLASPSELSASVTVMQRAGGALNTNLHFHTLVLDGVFTEAPEGALEFHPARGPSDAEVAAALATICQRVQRLLVRHGLEPADDATGRRIGWRTSHPVLAGIVGASVQGRVAL